MTTTPPLVFDAHLDLAMNAMEWNRDLRLSVKDIRKREEGLDDKLDRGKGTVAFPELRQGGVGLVVATQIARYVAPGSSLPGWQSPEQAWAQTQAQLAWYRTMEEENELVQITNGQELNRHLDRWSSGAADGPLPIGYILSLEGADSLVTVKHLERAYAYGLRAVGPAHYGPGRYANGTNATGKMGPRGLELLDAMDQLGMILDATHLCDDAFWQAMDHFKGPVWASHNNCRSIVPHNRQFSDEQINVLIERGAVIGAAMDAWMIVPDWKRGISTPQNMNCGLEQLVDHIDHICQLAGNCLHVGIGTDLDGGYGKEQSPHDIDTIADIQKIPDLLRKRGYREDDIERLLKGNWLRFLRQVWA
jgi:membrane dipeptidase